MEVSSAAEQLLFSTVRIETINDSSIGGVGTGFLFNYKKEQQQYPFLVTNKHVVRGAKTGRLTFHKGSNGKPVLGNPIEILVEDFDNTWYGHPKKDVDVAIMPYAPIIQMVKNKGDQIFSRNIPNSLIPSEEDIKKFDSLEEIMFIGYPIGIWDTKNRLPITRRGITATPLQVDYDGERKFLIDAAVFPGSSGSPVFLYNPGMYYDKKGSTVVGTRINLLGMIAEVFIKTEKNEIQSEFIPTKEKQFSISAQMINLGIVFKASTIVETIDSFITESANKKWQDVCGRNTI